MYTDDNKNVGDMVKDPVCNAYIIKRDAVKKWKNGNLYYFCSKGCAERFK